MEGQGHNVYEQPRREQSASGRNLSLEALFQVASCHRIVDNREYLVKVSIVRGNFSKTVVTQI